MSRPYEDGIDCRDASLNVRTLDGGRVQFLAADGDSAVIGTLTVGEARELSAIFGAAADIASLSARAVSGQETA